MNKKLQDLFLEDIEKRNNSKNLLIEVYGETNKGMGYAGIAMVEMVNKEMKK